MLFYSPTALFTLNIHVKRLLFENLLQRVVNGQVIDLARMRTKFEPTIMVHSI